MPVGSTIHSHLSDTLDIEVGKLAAFLYDNIYLRYQLIDIFP